MSEKIWFITGASRGFGKTWAKAALDRGDKVAATARNIATLQDLSDRYGSNVLPLALDVTDHDGLTAAVGEAHRHFGRLDVVLSNAGYGQMGAIEEVTLAEAHANFDTNVIGAISLIQAAVPLLRAQGSGHILAVSSVGGLLTFPLGGIYQATKFAVEALFQTLAQEVAHFGIRVTLIEPGPFATDFMSDSSLKHAKPIAAYDPKRQELANFLDPEMFGDPDTTSTTLLKIVDAEQPPLQVILGPLLPMVRQVYAARIATWEQWEPIAGDGPGA